MTVILSSTAIGGSFVVVTAIVTNPVANPPVPSSILYENVSDPEKSINGT